jgi:hypothetical protein
MLIELFSEIIQITTVIYPLLEFSNEPRCKRIDVNSSIVQFDNEEEMVFRRSGKGRLIDGDFKIDGGLASRS